jgi:hypothetical protein
MAKATLGFFYGANHKQYQLFYRLGYGSQNKYIYIGNHTEGNLFKYHKEKETEIHLMMPELRAGRWNRNIKLKHTRTLPLHVSKTDRDLYFILEMILKPKGVYWIDLKIPSREKLKDELFKHLVVKRLSDEQKV